MTPEFRQKVLAWGRLYGYPDDATCIRRFNERLAAAMAALGEH